MQNTKLQLELPFLIFNTEKSGQPATQYLTGFTGTTSITLLTRDEVYLITDGRYPQAAQELRPNATHLPSHKAHVIYVPQHSSYKQELGALLTSQNITSIHLDSSTTSFAQSQMLQELNVTATWHPNITQTIREFKTSAEKQLILQAARIARDSYGAIRHMIVPGATESQIAAALEYELKMRGAAGPAFPTMVISGARSASPHAVTSDKVIESQDAVILDFGCVYHGYCSDLTYTRLMPSASQQLHKIYDIVQEAFDAAKKVAVPGAELQRIDAAARDIIARAGYGAHFPHATGHGLGLDVHESPIVSPKSTGVLSADHVFTIEPGIYVEGLGGVRIEETVLFL